MLDLVRIYLSKDRKYLLALKNILGFTPRNLALYKLAFRHKSAATELANNYRTSNERLEFLGDAVLGAVVGEMLFKKYPFKDEGFLTETRSKIVNRQFLNQLARKIGLGEMIDHDARKSMGSLGQSSIYGDAFEALIGAIYLERGYDFVRQFILKRIIKPHVDVEELVLLETNFKSKVYEYAQRNGKSVAFELVPNDGAEKRLFTVRTLIGGEEFGRGQDHNKKNAEKIAAQKACEALGILNKE